MPCRHGYGTVGPAAILKHLARAHAHQRSVEQAALEKLKAMGLSQPITRPGVRPSAIRAGQHRHQRVVST